MEETYTPYLVRPCGPLLNEEGNVGRVLGDSYLGMTVVSRGPRMSLLPVRPMNQDHSLPWECVRKAASLVPPRTTESESDL